MAAIASRPHVVEIESQVRLLLDGYLMISMQVAVAATECSTQFIQYLLRRWNSESGIPEHSDDLRLPATIHTSPAVALETENPQSAVVRIVSALSTGTTTFVMLTLPRATVLFARTAGSEFGTARGRAGAQDPPHATGLLVGYHALGIYVGIGHPFAPGWPVSHRLAPGWLVGPPAATGASSRH